MSFLSELSLRIHILRYRVGLRKTLPAAIINRVKISESNEPMIDIRKCHDFFFGNGLEQRDAVYVRRGVYERLIMVTQSLPGEYRLKIMSAHRSLPEQQDLWNRQMVRTRAENPNASESELITINRRFVSQPHHGFGGHQTGGAVDVTLCDTNGADVGLGKWLNTDPIMGGHENKTSAQNLKTRNVRGRFC